MGGGVRGNKPGPGQIGETAFAFHGLLVYKKEKHQLHKNVCGLWKLK